MSNLLAMCKALDAGRRDQQVVLVSDALHLARIGWMLEAVDCLPGEVVGVALQPSPYDPPWPERVARVHADWVSRVAFSVLDIASYQSFIGGLRT